MIHGFGVIEQNVNLVMDPGETKTFKLKLTKAGVFPFYCTNFCSALHQEMQGYLVVRNAGETPPAPADMDEFEKKKAELVKRHLDDQRQAAVEALLNQLKRRARIQVNSAALAAV